MAVQQITSEGEKLSAIIRHRIDEYFNEFNIPDSDIYALFVESEDPDVIPRRLGVLGHISVVNGLKEYANNYCHIPLTANGYAVGLEIGFDNLNVSTVGLPSSSDIDYFPLYMMPMTLRDDNAYITDREEAMRKLLRTAILWFSVPFLEATTHYLDDKFYFDSRLNFGFGPAYEDVDNVVDAVLNKMDELTLQGTVSFKKYWDVTASGIVDLLNMNGLFSTAVDVGIGAIYNATLPAAVPLLPPYFGYIEGTAEFKTDFYTHVDFQILDGILGIPDIVVPYSVKVNPDFPTIIYKDVLMNANVIMETNYMLPRVEGNVTNILDNLEEATKRAINTESDFVYRKLVRDSELTEVQIVIHVLDIMRTLILVNDVADELMSSIGDHLENGAKLFTSVTRIPIWKTAMTTIVPYGYSIYLEEILPDFIEVLPKINTAIENVITSVNKATSNFGTVGIESIKEITSSKLVNIAVQLKYFFNDDDVFSYEEVLVDYAKIAAFVLLLGNVVKAQANVKITENTNALTTATALLAATKTANEGFANNPSTAATFVANEEAYEAQKLVTPLPGSEVSTTDPDYAAQLAVITPIETAFMTYANGKKTSINAQVAAINPEEILERLRKGEPVFEL